MSPEGRNAENNNSNELRSDFNDLDKFTNWAKICVKFFHNSPETDKRQKAKDLMVAMEILNPSRMKFASKEIGKKILKKTLEGLAERIEEESKKTDRNDIKLKSFQDGLKDYQIALNIYDEYDKTPSDFFEKLDEKSAS